jgi:hypothetical protein
VSSSAAVLPRTGYPWQVSSRRILRSHFAQSCDWMGGIYFQTRCRTGAEKAEKKLYVRILRRKRREGERDPSVTYHGHRDEQGCSSRGGFSKRISTALRTKLRLRGRYLPLNARCRAPRVDFVLRFGVPKSRIGMACSKEAWTSG